MYAPQFHMILLFGISKREKGVERKMDRLIFIDFDGFAAKLLNDEDRKALDGLDISLYIDTDSYSIHRGVYLNKVLPDEKIIEQEQIIRKFMDLLYADVEIQSLMGKAQKKNSMESVAYA
jgi:hypothetical protein